VARGAWLGKKTAPPVPIAFLNDFGGRGLELSRFRTMRLSQNAALGGPEWRLCGPEWSAF